MNTTLLFMGIGTQEFLFLALIILLLFGGKKIPELMKGCLLYTSPSPRDRG